MNIPFRRINSESILHISFGRLWNNRPSIRSGSLMANVRPDPGNSSSAASNSPLLNVRMVPESEFSNTENDFCSTICEQAGCSFMSLICILSVPSNANGGLLVNIAVPPLLFSGHR